MPRKEVAGTSWCCLNTMSKNQVAKVVFLASQMPVLGPLQSSVMRKWAEEGAAEMKVSRGRSPRMMTASMSMYST